MENTFITTPSDFQKKSSPEPPQRAKVTNIIFFTISAPLWIYDVSKENFMIFGIIFEQ